MEQIRGKKSQCSESQAETYRELRSLHLATADLISVQRDLERQQQRASEEEQFEKAEELSERLVKGNQQLSTHNTRVLALREKLMQIQKTRKSVMQSEIDLRNGTLVSQLKVLEEKQSSVVTSLKKAVAAQRAQNDEALSSRSEDILKERSHVELDLKLVVERESKIQAAIDEQTVQLRESKTQLKSKLDLVQREIADLLEKLRLKRLEETEYLQEIGAIDEDIDSVTSKFTKELRRVTENKERAQARVAKLEADTRELEEERQKFEASIATLVQNQQREEILLNKIRGDLSASHAAVAKTEKVKNAVEQIVSGLESCLVADQTWIASLEFKRQTIISLEDEIRSVSEKNLQSAKSIQAAKQRALVLKTDILPELEASKKAAAGARNFKEAAALQKDIKENQGEVEELEKKIEMLQAQSSQDAQLLQKLSNDLATHSAALQELERNHGAILQYSFLSQIETHLILLVLRSGEIGDFKEGDCCRSS
jgi:chromosome segregation ATPase